MHFVNSKSVTLEMTSRVESVPRTTKVFFTDLSKNYIQEFSIHSSKDLIRDILYAYICCIYTYTDNL
jgi:hypothetical protein